MHSGENSEDIEEGELDDEAEDFTDFIAEPEEHEKRAEKRRREVSDDDSLEGGLDHDLMGDDEGRPSKRAKRLTRLKKKDESSRRAEEETQSDKLANLFTGDEGGYTLLLVFQVLLQCLLVFHCLYDSVLDYTLCGSIGTAVPMVDLNCLSSLMYSGGVDFLFCSSLSLFTVASLYLFSRLCWANGV